MPVSRHKLVHTRTELEAAIDRTRGDVALVMTMGALHRGHAELIRAARLQASTVVVSVFVNPLQFGPAEDYDRYPRTLEADVELCATENVDVVFAPTASEVYPSGVPDTRIVPGPAGLTHEGALRPDLFSGVLTVVAKFFHMVQPDLAVFGEKDAQQLFLVRRMASDLDFPVRVVGMPTVREPDGLAVSSRNAYLSAEQRGTALALNRALQAAEAQADNGAFAVLGAARKALSTANQLDPPLRIDSLELVDAATFAPVSEDFRGCAVLAVIGLVGRTRLIDNLPLVIRGPDEARRAGESSPSMRYETGRSAS
jgi:pantoate--beta-alanine ligase